MKAVKFSVAAAAALALSTAAMANPTVYGQINGEFGSFADSYVKDSTSSLNAKSFGSRFGVKGSHDLGDGLTGLYQLEAGFDPMSNEATSDKSELDGRNSFVGVKGSFGTVILGNHDTPYKIAARGAGAVAHTDATDTLTLQENRVNKAVAYIAPIEGMTVAAAIVPVPNSANDSGDSGMHMSLGFLMPMDNLKVAAGYESVYNQTADTASDSIFAGANMGMGNMTVGAFVETNSDDGTSIYNRVLVPFTMNMDGGMFVNASLRMTMYTEDNAAGDESEMKLGASVGKKFDKSMEAYAALMNTSNSGGATDAAGTDIAVGMRVYF